MRSTARGLAATLSLLGVLLAGCGKPVPPPQTATTPAPQADAAAPQANDPGVKVFLANRCANCHHLDSLGGGSAPDLTHIGAQRDAAWLTEHVKDPQSHKSGSRMPSYAGKLSDSDLAALATMLAAHK